MQLWSQILFCTKNKILSQFSNNLFDVNINYQSKYRVNEATLRKTEVWFILNLFQPTKWKCGFLIFRHFSKSLKKNILSPWLYILNSLLISKYMKAAHQKVTQSMLLVCLLALARYYLCRVTKHNREEKHTYTPYFKTNLKTVQA